MSDAIRAALDAAPEATRLELAQRLAGEAWRVVPVEPTPAMVHAAPGRPNQATEESMYHGIYRAMLAAAVEAAAKEGERNAWHAALIAVAVAVVVLT
jgi:hypothetical protein